MQRVSKKLEEKIQAISKIQTKRKKRNHLSQLADNNMISLPPIVNALSVPSKVTPLIPRMTLTLTSHSRKKIQSQLDAIINDTITHFKDQKVNRIIFATPLANRLGKTYYRSNQLHSFDIQNSRRFSQERQKELERRKIECDEFFNQPLRLSKKVEQTAPSSAPQEEKTQSRILAYQLYHATHKQGTLMKYAISHKTGRLDDVRKNRKGRYLQQRYSPWKNEEREEELTL